MALGLYEGSALPRGAGLSTGRVAAQRWFWKDPPRVGNEKHEFNRGSVARTGLVVGAAVVMVALLPTVSCSSRAPNEAPPGGSAPTKVAPSTTATLNPETSLERRIRLDQEAAVSAYRAAVAEVDRLFKNGGANKPTPRLASLTEADYLAFTMQTLRTVKKNEWRGVGSTRVVAAQAQGWSRAKIHIKACEDVSEATILDSKGKDQTPAGEQLYLQDYTVRKSLTGWKVSDVTTKPVSTFAGYGCDDL